jgi:tRNA (cytidine/uridine-2'-O-)-methyltransferase
VNAQPPLHVVLYQPEIPQNTGNIGRTCVAVGARLWLVHPLGFRLDDARRKRAGLDYWEHLDWEQVEDWAALRARLPARLWLFSKFGTRDYTEADFAVGDALVFGSETQGLPPSLRSSLPDQVLRIPMREAARSLNLASAAAVGIYEAMRQIRSAVPGARRSNIAEQSGSS